MPKIKYQRRFVFLISIFVLITIVLTQIIPQPKSILLPEKTIVLPNKAFAVLVLGTDSMIPGKLDGWNSRSDFILVLYYNPYYKNISLLSVPRDTYITLAMHPDIHKINAANQLGGYQMSRRAVSRLLNIKIDYTMVFSIEGVIQLIDTFGPMKIYVPKEMVYDDHSANLHINIRPGLQIMNGKKLIEFLRYRNSKLGDIGRIQRQQVFFRAAIKKLTEPQILLKLPNALSKVNKVFVTDMSFKKMFEIAMIVKAIPRERFETYILPGDFGDHGYWLPDYNRLSALVQKITYESTQGPQKISAKKN